jgi:alkylation response protein AidB-like acyl-CoA dehydrogenase
VDFELSDDQVALRDAARALLDGRASPKQVREVVDADLGIDDGLWAEMIAQGWTALAVPEDQGGLGLGIVELALLLEEVGGHAAPAPVLQQALALDALVEGDGPAELIDALVAGDAIGTAAFTPVEAVGSGGAWRLTGRPEPVIHAPAARVAVVRSSDAVFVVDGVSSAAEPAMDRTRSLGWIELDHTSAVRLGGPEAVERFVDLGAVGHAAELLGASARVLDLAVEYAKERVQFGRPIGSFQAVKHRCADMLVDVEGMRSAVYHAAWALGAGDPDASVAASTAKTWCSEASRRVMASGLQVHGGIGFTWEHDLHLFVKRAQLDGVSFGDATWHRDRLGRLLRQRIDAGQPLI